MTFRDKLGFARVRTTMAQYSSAMYFSKRVPLLATNIEIEKQQESCTLRRVWSNDRVLTSQNTFNRLKPFYHPSAVDTVVRQ